MTVTKISSLYTLYQQWKYNMTLISSSWMSFQYINNPHIINAKAFLPTYISQICINKNLFKAAAGNRITKYEKLNGPKSKHKNDPLWGEPSEGLVYKQRCKKCHETNASKLLTSLLLQTYFWKYGDKEENKYNTLHYYTHTRKTRHNPHLL